MVGELEHPNRDLHQILHISMPVLQDSRDFQRQLDTFSFGLCKLSRLIKILGTQQLEPSSLLINHSVSGQDRFLRLRRNQRCFGVQAALMLLFSKEQASIPIGTLHGDKRLRRYSRGGPSLISTTALAVSPRALG
ncbi:hypothetical protein NHF46_00325 [Arthrobacter alpinus]|uniref:hypothetical protein n=1 Tax=Specibacter sp. NPDC078692 TaxID=3155818 RepID=UPI00209D01A9|nr:hypothetical protein [Arthrobacter alpinus]